MSVPPVAHSNSDPVAADVASATDAASGAVSPAGATDTPTPGEKAAPEPRLFNLQTFGTLARGPFGRYVAGDSMSMIGLWMQGFAQSWVMTGLTSTAFYLSLIQVASSVPMLGLTMWGGTIADRHDKRRIIIVCQFLQMLLAASVGWLVMSGLVQIWHLITAAFLLGITAAFEVPATNALVPELVDKEHISTAIAIDRSVFHGSRLVGPALAGPIIARLGQAAAFYFNAFTFLPSIVAIASIQPRPRGTDEEEEQRTSGMGAGIAYVRGDKPTVAMLSLMTANALWVFPFLAVMMTLYSRDVLKLDATHTGWLMGISGAGSLLASAGVMFVSKSQRMLWMIVASVLLVSAMGALSAARSFEMALAALAVMSAGTSLNYALANTIVQERAPGPLRGRVSALAMLSFVGVLPFTAMGMTALADRIGMRTAMALAAAGYAVTSLAVLAGPARHMNDLPSEPPLPAGA